MPHSASANKLRECYSEWILRGATVGSAAQPAPQVVRTPGRTTGVVYARQTLGWHGDRGEGVVASTLGLAEAIGFVVYTKQYREYTVRRDSNDDMGLWPRATLCHTKISNIQKSKKKTRRRATKAEDQIAPKTQSAAAPPASNPSFRPQHSTHLCRVDFFFLGVQRC